MAGSSERKSALVDLAEMPPLKLLFRYSWPALIAMSLNALYSVVDRIFIGQGCGVDAMAGLTLTMPVVMLFAAFGVFVGAGHAAVLSIRLGEGNHSECERIVGELLALKLAFFLVLPPLVFFNLDTVLGWCGADKVTPGAFAAAKDYLKLVIFSHIFSHIAFGLSALQRAEGGAIRSMVCIVVGFAVNLALDPIFIFTFGMGIRGAAWATNIAMFLSCVCALWFYLGGHTAVALKWRRIRFYPSILGRACSIGLAPFLQQLMSSVIVISLQLCFTRWIPDGDAATDQIASLGVFHAVLILVFMPMLGAQQGLQPILGYNWGARNYRRVLATLRTGFWVTTALTFIACIIQTVPPFPEWLARMFIDADQPALIKLAAHDLTLSNCMIWCISFNVVATTYFQSIGKPWVAIFLSMLRQGVVLLPMIWVLPYFLDDKTFAIWLAMPVSDVVCNVVTILPLWLHVRFLSKVREREDFR